MVVSVPAGLLHPLDLTVEPPQRFNNPFYYTPDALCRGAMNVLTAWLDGSVSQCFSSRPPSSAFRAEIARGKMFGVLIVETPCPAPSSSPTDGPAPPRYQFLAGYSGQIGGRSDWPDFVPAVFDYLQPDGYFKREEAAIVELGRQLAQLPRPRPWDGTAVAPRPPADKERRQGETDEAYIRRRQFENAELHRWKLGQRALREAFEAGERQKAERIQTLKRLRRQRSDALQTWLFRHFVMCNARGGRRNLVDIFADHRLEPPGGAGECCEPRLLHYAFSHGLRPVSMAMFWWGESPRGEVRHHLLCYPACNGKCKPLLPWMLRGMDVASNPLEQPSAHTLPMVYEDDWICVVDKPAGMLSVPGKNGRESVLGLLRRRYPAAEGPLIVHRLDMDTSGLMVVALTMEAYLDLQRQFLRREVSKRYVAELVRPLAVARGSIALPLRPDLSDRPRQMVDRLHGRPAETRFERIDGRRVALYPHTGRTHQLRVHCAHRQGLDNPIVGDALYGQRADRLHLHAQNLSFRHPQTGRQMTFTSLVPF